MEVSDYQLLDDTPSDISMVSVAMLTYNHENYIVEAIEGVLMQQTKFFVKLVIAEDCSTDRTRQIIMDYQKEYPEKIKLVIQDKNVGPYKNTSSLFENLDGKYIALCEGDDYWIDPLKLQKQVDFLEENEDCSFVFTNAEVINEVGEVRGMNVLQAPDRYYSGEEILMDWIVPTASVLFRKLALTEKYYARSKKNYYYGDIILFLSLCEYGKAYGMTQATSVYRRHSAGFMNSAGTKNFEQHKLNAINHSTLIAEDFGGKYKKICYKHISDRYLVLFGSTKKLNYLHNYNYYLFLHSPKSFFSVLNFKTNTLYFISKYKSALNSKKI